MLKEEYVSLLEEKPWQEMEEYFNKLPVAEIKSREMSIEELKGYGSYLISYDKINTGRALSGLIGVPYLLYVKLIKDNTIVYWKVTDNNGNYIVNFNTKKTETKNNCNGGKALRENSYIQLDEMKVLSI